MTLPDYFVRIVNLNWKQEGAAWLDALPGLIREFEQQWSITVLPHYTNLSYNYVAPALRADGSPAVLKIGVPRDEIRTEIEALRLYDGRAVRLYEGDPTRGAMLIEQLSPGKPLTTITDDEQATRIAAETMRGLWVPAPESALFPRVEDWDQGLDKHSSDHPLPRRLVDLAINLFADLHASMGARVLLHGDLHHDNILSADQGWRVIDPKGILGEAEYEIGALLRNPLGVEEWPNLRQISARRIDVLSEMLGFDRQRLIRWAVAQAVLSAWWNVEDMGEGWEGAITIAEVFVEMLNH